MLKQRIRKLNRQKLIAGPIVYWMSRDQRLSDNWALIAAQETALELKQPLIIVFCLTKFPSATDTHYQFMLRGLEQVRAKAQELNIPFVCLQGEPVKTLNEFCSLHKVGAVFCDFSPLRLGREWRGQLATKLLVAMYEVDTHNIVPVWTVSAKQEFAARTLRPKLYRFVSEFADSLKQPILHPYQWLVGSKGLNAKTSLPLTIKGSAATATLLAGEQSALNHFFEFASRLQDYAELRNDPNARAQSGLSPYLHFGQISSQRILIELQKLGIALDHPFIEELFVRKELADNYCFYNANYDNFAGFPAWAQKTLNAHRLDPREYIYDYGQFEQAQTHDELWNAAQLEMVNSGKMHGYMRMYWAKKILEWTPTPELAQEIAIALNDKYQLDGRDPNGYTGIAWSIGGVHDRPWFNRPIFGSIRYMSRSGLERKFDVQSYILQNI